MGSIKTQEPNYIINLAEEIIQGLEKRCRISPQELHCFYNEKSHQSEVKFQSGAISAITTLLSEYIRLVKTNIALGELLLPSKITASIDVNSSYQGSEIVSAHLGSSVSTDGIWPNMPVYGCADAAEKQKINEEDNLDALDDIFSEASNPNPFRQLSKKVFKT